MSEMNIEINYDLFDKIKESKGKLSLKRVFKYTKGFIIGSLVGNLICYPIFKDAKALITNLALYTLSPIIASIVVSSFFNRRNKQYIIRNAKSDLIDLDTKIRQDDRFDYVISGRNLSESELYKTHYNFKLNDKRIPVLKQTKYFVVQSFTNDCDIHMVQEHNIGTRNYVLKLGSPTT